MPTTKILVYLAVWKRPEITELCFVGLQRLKEHPDFDIQVLAVISEEEMIPLCEKYGVMYVMHENQPLGEKKNAGLKEASKLDFDYMMEIGSDDLVMNELLDWYKPSIKSGLPFFGVRDVAFIESETGICHRLHGGKGGKTPYGAGRMISRAALHKMRWKLWTDRIKKGLDADSTFNMHRNGITYKAIELNEELPMIIDIKSEQNIWKFNYFIGVPFDKNILYSKITTLERALIESYVTEFAADREA